MFKLFKMAVVYTKPKVGVGVILTSAFHPRCVLIGKRKGSLGSGTHGLPGGHLEFGEEWHECAARETLEETGLIIKNISFGTIVNSIIKEQDYHYITIFMKAEIDTDNGPAEPHNMEPDKCEGWDWCEWNSFPVPLFDSLRLAREQGYMYDPYSNHWFGHEKSSLYKIHSAAHLTD